MRITWTVLIMAMMLCACSAIAQAQQPEPAAPPAAEADEPQPPPIPPEIAEKKQMFMQFGVDEGTATMLSVLTSGEIDPMTMMILMMAMGDKGGDMDDIFGMMMFSNMMKQGGKGAEAVWFREGEFLYVVDGGVLYKLNTETMELIEKLNYKKGPDQTGLIMALLGPMMGQAKGKAEQVSCLSNLKQLGLAAMMYTQDHDGVFPEQGWVQALEPYHKNAQILRCPSRPELPVGYAMNDKLLGMEIGKVKDPSQIALFFESNVGGDAPLGNAADVPDGGVHDGSINVVFADGHAKLYNVNEARAILAREPTE